RRAGGLGRRRPGVAGERAAAPRHIAARRAAVVERRGDGGDEVLVGRDAQQLAHVRQPPIGVAREVRPVERRHVRERVRPRVLVVIVVNRPVVRELLPHEPGVHVRDRPVPVVDVGERGPLPELAVLARARAGDDGSTTVPARRLPGRRQPARRHERGGRRGAAARGGGARRGGGGARRGRGGGARRGRGGGARRGRGGRGRGARRGRGGRGRRRGRAA